MPKIVINLINLFAGYRSIDRLYFYAVNNFNVLRIRVVSETVNYCGCDRTKYTRNKIGGRKKNYNIPVRIQSFFLSD